MSIEPWGLMALLVVIFLLQAAGRARRPRDGRRVADEPVVQTPPPVPAVLPPVLPPPAVPQTPSRRRRSHAAKRTRTLATQPVGKAPSPSEDVRQWLRPTSNLRRAIIAAVILGPPAHSG